MTKKPLNIFHNAWSLERLANLRQAAFDKIEELKLPIIERVKFHRWNFGRRHAFRK